MEDRFSSAGVHLLGHLAVPEEGKAAPGHPGLVVCHGFPSDRHGTMGAVATYPELADRIAAETGWTVFTFSFRGVGASGGDFSLSGWVEDLRAAVDRLFVIGSVERVWLAGASTGGSLAICVASEDERVRGVAALSARADFDDWAAHPRQFLNHCRDIGVVRNPKFPVDPEVWALEFKEIRPVSAAASLSPRPLLLIQGSEDEVVPAVDARALADCHGDAELRIIGGAGHLLRDDPRAIALLLGWLERQTPID